MSPSQDAFGSVLALAPEFALGLAAFVALFLGKRSSKLAGLIALAGLSLAAALLIVRGQNTATTVLAMVEIDHFATFFQALMTAGCAIVVLSWTFGRCEPGEIAAERFFLLLCALLGGYLMVGTNHALLFVLGFELLSLGSIALTITDARRALGGEAAMKAFVFTGFATALMIYGLSLLYGLTGTLDFARMGAGDVSVGAQGLAQQLASNPLPVALALVLVLAGIACKIALAPMHFWTPDVYAGSPTPVAMFFSVVSKVAGFGALLRFLSALFVQDRASHAMLKYASKFGLLLAVLAALTMTIGNLAALRQPGLKRLFAYSSIAQIGFAMIGVACLNETGFAAALLYIATFALMNAGAYVALIYFESSIGSDQLDDMRGLGWRAPFVGVGAILVLASLIGLPPTIGFYAKYRVFVEAWNVGYGWLVFVAAINTLISVYCAFRVLRVLFLHEPSERQPIRARVLVTLAVVLSLATLLQGIWPRSFEQWTTFALDLLRN